MKLRLRVLRYASLVALALPASGGAQIAVDGTFGPAQELPAIDNRYDINAALGEQRGGNLFHSFSRFDVPRETVATFSGPNTVANIIARVTGSSASTIDGSLRSTIEGADLFFFNPNGVLFGESSALDLRGSLHVSTADFIELGDGGRFDAADPSRSTLTVAPPSAFGFGSGAHGALTVRRTLLEVPQRERISLIGGDVTLDGGAVRAPGGEVNIVSVQGEGRAPFDGVAQSALEEFHAGTIAMTAVDIDAPPGSAAPPRQNVDMRLDDGPIREGGRVSIRGGRLVIEGGGVRTAGGDVDVWTGTDVVLESGAEIDARRSTRGVLPEPGNRAGAIRVQTAKLFIGDGSRLESTGGSSIDSGPIKLDVGRLEMRGFSTIEADAVFSGNAGDVTVVANEIDLDGEARISSGAASLGTGVGGLVSLAAESIRLAGQTTIATSTVASDGAGGVIKVDAGPGTVRMEGLALLFALTFGDEPAGRVEVKAGSLLMSERAGIGTNTLAGGEGGRIDIDVDRLEMSGSSVITSGTEGFGPGGVTNITLGSGVLKDDSVISTESEGDNELLVRVIRQPTPPTGGGKGGELLITRGGLTLEDNARIVSSTAGVGDAGSIAIQVPTLAISQGARIAALSDASGLAGNIEIRGASSITLSGGAIATSARLSDGGNITLEARDLVYLNRAEITTSVSELDGSGGNIEIDPVFVVLNNSRIVARAREGAGGNIRIVAQGLIQDTQSIIDASSEFGLDGSVIIESPEEDISESLSALPGEFLDASSLVSTPCGLRTRAQASSLLVERHGAVLPSPDDLQHGSVISHLSALKAGASSDVVTLAPEVLFFDAGLARAAMSGGWATDCANGMGR